MHLSLARISAQSLKGPMTSTEIECCAWLRKAAALEQGVSPLTYLSITAAVGPGRAFRQHANVRFSGGIEATIDEVCSHLEDIGANAIASGGSGYGVRIHLYRESEPAGSRTFRSRVAPGSDGHGVEEEHTRAGEIVLMASELRRALADSTGALSRSSAKGWDLAAAAYDRSMDLLEENARLKAEGSSHHMAELAKVAAPLLIATLPRIAEALTGERVALPTATPVVAHLEDGRQVELSDDQVAEIEAWEELVAECARRGIKPAEVRPFLSMAPDRSEPSLEPS